MSENLIQQLISFPTNAPSSNALWAAMPQRQYELSEEEAGRLTAILTDSMDTLSELLVDEAQNHSTVKVMKEQLALPFFYAFDKGIEIVYKMRVDSEDAVEFNLEEMDDGAGDQIPESIQQKVTAVIPIVMMVFNETIDFAEQDATSSLEIQELFKSILTGGMFLGVEFCLRLELE